MSKASSLAKNTTILAVGKLSYQLISFVLLPLYTYYLSPSEYGFVDLVTVYMALLIPALTLQLEMASFRYLVDARKSESERARVISNILYIALPLVAPWLVLFVAYGVTTGFEYTWLILFAGVAMLCSNLTQQIARGLGDNKNFAIASLLIGLTTLIGALVFIVYMGLRIDGMLLSVAAANVVAAVYLTVRMKLYRYIKLGVADKQLQREMLGYSVPLVPNEIAWWAISASNRTIISIMISTSANGIYAVSTKYAAILGSLFGIFNMSWTEAASMHINAPDRDKFFSQVANASMRLFGALGLGLIATMPFLFPLMVNEEFYEAYLYIPVMVIGVFLNAVVGIYSAIYVAKKLTKQVMNTSLVAAALNIVLTVSLIPLFGLYAAASATALAFLAMAVFRHYDVKKYVNITYNHRSFAMLGLAFIVVSSLYYVNNPVLNVLNMLIVLAISISLNRSIISIIKTKLFARLRPLTPDQQILEEIEEKKL